MSSNNTRTTKIPLIPLPKGSVLLPKVLTGIPFLNRPDITNLLPSREYRSQPSKNGNALTFGCIPLNSPLLSKDGKNLIENGGMNDAKKEESQAVDVKRAKEEDLFQYGTVGKLVGLQRYDHTEPQLLVQGVQRFTVKRVWKEKQFLEAEVTLHEDPGK